VVEVEVDLHHNPTGRNLAGILHRARQARAIARELTRRRAWRPTPDGRSEGRTASAEPPADAGSPRSRGAETPGDPGSPQTHATETPGDAGSPGTHHAETPGDAGSPGWEGSPRPRGRDAGYPQPPEAVATAPARRLW
jgi:hypothetical protein